MFHSRRSIKRPGSSLSDQFCKKIKWVNGRWCVGHSFLPSSSIQGQRKSASKGAKENRVQESCGYPSIPTSQCLIEHTWRQREGRWLKVGRTLPGLPARCPSQVEGVPSREGSWGFLGVAVGYV